MYVQPFYDHYTGQPRLVVGTPNKEPKDCVGKKFHCPHTLEGSNYHIKISEKMLEFSYFVIFQMAAAAILNFQKFEILIVFPQ